MQQGQISEAEFAELAGEKTCRYCDQPVHYFEDGEGGILCDFHYDWEAACNVVEDECGGSTPGALVHLKMREWGWGDLQIDARLSRETV